MFSKFNTLLQPKAAPISLQESVPVKFQKAIAFHQTGQLAQAKVLYEDILATQANHADALHLLGLIALQTGEAQRAVDLISKATKIDPNNAAFYVNLGSALRAIQQPAAAVDSYDKALALSPNNPDIYFNRGNALLQLKQAEAAVASYDKAIAARPSYAEAYSSRGNALEDLKQLEAAVASYDRAIAIRPDYADAHYNRGNALKGLKKLGDAVASYDKAIAFKPSFAEAYANRGSALQDLKKLADAVASYDKAIAIKPDSAEAYYNRGNALRDLKQLDAAVASYDKAAAIKPDFALAHYNCGVAHESLGDVGKAEKSYRRALEINPQLSEAHHNLAVALQSMGNIQAAALSYRSALACAPNLIESHTGLLSCLSSDVEVDAATLFAEYLRFGEQFEGPLRAQWQPHLNAKEPERRLNVGFVSGDFCNHSVATFIEPVLQELSKSIGVTLHAYYNNGVQDAVTQRLKTYFSHWNPVAGMADAELAQKIRADGIDILIDLSGHTVMNRLLTFAMKPAPIQATWIGFPGTTGLQSMDYYLTDPFFLPPGQFDNQFTEKLVYLPATAPFLPSEEAPEVNALPALRNGHITFGSFNKIKKFNPTVIALWAQVLRAQPDSRMLVGGIEPAEKSTVLEWFAREGIASERLRFCPRSDMKTYLGSHHQVDICLDTFPYNGGTTTMHALWMGVPTLTLSGPTALSRCGTSILGHMGLQTFQANNRQEFLECSLMWAGKLDELSQIRATLRERFTASPMGQPPVIAAGLERAFRTMWQRWCSQLSAVSFEST